MDRPPGKSRKRREDEGQELFRPTRALFFSIRFAHRRPAKNRRCPRTTGGSSVDTSTPQHQQGTRSSPQDPQQTSVLPQRAPQPQRVTTAAPTSFVTVNHGKQSGASVFLSSTVVTSGSAACTGAPRRPVHQAHTAHLTSRRALGFPDFPARHQQLHQRLSSP